MTPNDVLVYMVTYKRPNICEATLRGLVASMPTGIPVVVQANDDSFRLPADLAVGGQVRCVRGPRPESSAGHLSADWNAGRRAASAAHRPWILGIHDDMVVAPGWWDLVCAEAARGTVWFHAPGGDMMWLAHADVFERVGGWDERFLGTGWKEWDLYIRILQFLAWDAVVMEDTHGSGFAITNIGLSRFWRGGSADHHLFRGVPEWHAARGAKETDAVWAAHRTFVAKWGQAAMNDIDRSAYACVADPNWIKRQHAEWWTSP